MNPRLRRLGADRERIEQAFGNNPRIHLVSTEGEPPERYAFDIHVDGLSPDNGDGPLPVSSHRVEVFLPLDYPRRAPFCRMLSEVFHPNIDPQKICIGDHWSAGQTLDQLVLRIAEMICYQSYNTRSPLNARAAAWAEQNPERLPLTRADLAALDQ